MNRILQSGSVADAGGYLSLHFSPTLYPPGGASEAPPQYPKGVRASRVDKSGPAGSVTGIVLAHFRRGAGMGALRGKPRGLPR
jgi:hypothetical protein